MRSRIILMAALLVLSLPLAAGTPTAGTAGPARPAAGTGSSPAVSPAAQEELEEFIPSEKVPADTAISFPVDI